MKNKLSSADAILEAVKMENKNLEDKLIAATKENTKLKNSLRSQFEDKQLASTKLVEVEKQNAKLKEEITMVRKNLEAIKKSYSDNCKKLDEKVRKIEELNLVLADMKRKIQFYENERSSYRKTMIEVKKAHSTLIKEYAKEGQFQMEIDGIKRTLNENCKNLSALSHDLREVYVRLK